MAALRKFRPMTPEEIPPGYYQCQDCGVVRHRKKGPGAPRKWCGRCNRLRETMAKKPDATFCAMCDKKFQVKKGRGRGKIYCSRACRFASFKPLARKPRNFSCAHCGIACIVPTERTGRTPKYCARHRLKKNRTPQTAKQLALL